MKRLSLIFTTLCTLLFLLLPSLPAQAAAKIPVYVDNLPVTFDVQPVIKSGRTLVPFRAIAESLNVAVAWDGKTQTVTAKYDATTVSLRIGSRTAYLDGAPVTLDTPPQLNNGRTLIPLRFFSEAFGCTVLWEAAATTVKISSPPTALNVVGFYALGDGNTSSWTDLFDKAYPDTTVGNTDIVDEVAMGWYSLDEQGNLLTKSTTGWQRPDGWEKVLDSARQYGLKTQMVVHVTDGNGTITELLNNQEAMSKATASIAAEAKLYSGVNLDFEGLGLSDTGEKLTLVRNSFTEFTRLLSEDLKGSGVTLTLSLHAPNSSYHGYDYKALGELADYIIIMAYDYGQKPEPVSLVIQAVEKAKAEVPVGKLILGISAPSESAESIIAKVGIAKRYGLNGIALWRLGLVPDDMWDSLRQTVQVKKEYTDL